MDYHHIVAKCIYYMKDPNKKKVLVLVTLLGKLCDGKTYNINYVSDIVVNLLRIYTSSPENFSNFIKLYENKTIDKTTDYLIKKLCEIFENEDEDILSLLLKEHLVFVENVRNYKNLSKKLNKLKEYYTEEEYNKISKELLKHIAKGSDIYGTYF